MDGNLDGLFLVVLLTPVILLTPLTVVIGFVWRLRSQVAIMSLAFLRVVSYLSLASGLGVLLFTYVLDIFANCQGSFIPCQANFIAFGIAMYVLTLISSLVGIPLGIVLATLVRSAVPEQKIKEK